MLKIKAQFFEDDEIEPVLDEQQIVLKLQQLLQEAQNDVRYMELSSGVGNRDFRDVNVRRLHGQVWEIATRALAIAKALDEARSELPAESIYMREVQQAFSSELSSLGLV